MRRATAPGRGPSSAAWSSPAADDRARPRALVKRKGSFISLQVEYFNSLIQRLLNPMLMPKTSTAPEPQKLLGLEGLRFVATLAVLLWHYQHFAFVGDTPVGLVRSELPFYRALFPFYEAGQSGVVVFWCISG